ncbi:hypothetical protein EV702DRAFT_1277199 [Suillus placidus]|uniref:F-box domain-containing protein n=1 Tax=Suillus placidus TaxID=48579 RepID=A0A9P6ZZT4_9AGAM|nr:hypothetical protein EV702DRAFT_1277199 [Suillus placidus]
MNQFHRATSRLLDFPVETLSDILGHLDPYELLVVRARQICNDVLHASVVVKALDNEVDYSAHALQLAAKLSFPALRIPFQYKCTALSPILFHAHTHDQIIIISMNLSGWLLATKSLCFIFYVERNTLLELESTSGAQITPDPSRRAYPRKHSFCGPELYLWLGPLGDQKSQLDPLCIHYFNSHRMVDFKAGNGTRWDQRLIEGAVFESVLGATWIWSPISRDDHSGEVPYDCGSKLGDAAVLRSYEHDSDAMEVNRALSSMKLNRALDYLISSGYLPSASSHLSA